MKNSNRSAKRILLITSMLILMLSLCGCRTRLTNNTEVGNTVSDESGYLSDSYQMRRNELGLSVAEEPIFNTTSSDADDEDYSDYDTDAFDSYDPESYDDFEDDDDSDDSEDSTETSTSTSTSTTTTSSSTTTTRRSSTGTIRRSTTTTTALIKVTLNANGGKCSTSMISVRKGGTYSSLPTPTRSGYTFNGWYTAKTGGSKITKTTKVTKSTAHTLYAQWTEITVKTYTVSFDANADGDDYTISSTALSVEEDGTYPELPTVTRDKYAFKGWFTDKTGGSQVQKGDSFANADQTLYAHWEQDYYNWWNNQFKTKTNDQTLDTACLVYDGDQTEKSFVEACKGRLTDVTEAPAYVIAFRKNYTDDEWAEEQAKTVYSEYKEKYEDIYPDSTPSVIIISDEAVKGSDNQKLMHKMKLADTLYGIFGSDIEKAAADLETEGRLYVYVPEGDAAE